MMTGTLAAVVLFAAVFILGGKLHRPHNMRRRGLFSFSAGAAVAYIFVHLSPELQIAQDVFVKETAHPFLPFALYSIHVATMIGFIVFYGLEQFVIGSREITEGQNVAEEHPGGMSFRIHVGVFAMYSFLVAYLLVDNLEGATVPIIFYTVAMCLHFLTVGHSLHQEYGALYDRVGARLLAASTFAGWGTAMVTDFPKPLVAVLLGFIAGGVMVNTIITELPTEKEGRFLPFLIGSICYTVLLLLSV
jgi:hypothetical protein